MTKPMTVVKSCGPRLVPFFKSVTLFFILYDGESVDSSIVYCIFKCLPILSLIIFVLMYGMDLSDTYYYARRILIGLIFSMIGDICMVYKGAGYFIHGVAFFALAQVTYAFAFGLLKPLKLYVLGVVSLFGAGIYALLLPGLDGVMRYIVLGYLFLIMTMLWRAIARVRLYYNRWTWTSMCSCLGSICFVISDTCIAFNKFRFEIPFADTLIMVTYYAAQLGITLSVVESQVDIILEKTRADSRENLLDLLKDEQEERNGNDRIRVN